MLGPRYRETVAQEAARLGLSIRQVYRIRARKRDGSAPWLRSGPASRDEWLDRYDYPYMELVSRTPEDPMRPWCVADPAEHDPDAISEDGGKWHLGDRVATIRFGRVAEEEGPRKEQPSEKRAVNPKDRAKGIVYVQPADRRPAS